MDKRGWIWAANSFILVFCVRIILLFWFAYISTLFPVPDTFECMQHCRKIKSVWTDNFCSLLIFLSLLFISLLLFFLSAASALSPLWKRHKKCLFLLCHYHGFLLNSLEWWLWSRGEGAPVSSQDRQQKSSNQEPAMVPISPTLFYFILLSPCRSNNSAFSHRSNTAKLFKGMG